MAYWEIKISSSARKEEQEIYLSEMISSLSLFDKLSALHVDKYKMLRSAAIIIFDFRQLILMYSQNVN